MRLKRDYYEDNTVIGRLVKCPSCNEVMEAVPLRNEFDYAGTHCTYGQSGVHYPSDWGTPVSQCCSQYVGEEHVVHPEDMINDELYNKEVI